MDDDEPEVIEANCRPMTYQELAAAMLLYTKPAPPDVPVDFDPDDYPLF